MLARESLYVGIDIARQRHVAGFVSATLLARHQRFEVCPALVFDNSRDGFRLLADRIRAYVPLEQCFVLMEKTGHYHRALEGYLLELDVAVYLVHVQARPPGMIKTDKRDALGLANHLYNQLEKGIQVADTKQLVRRAHPPTEAAVRLKALLGHRHELTHEASRRKNKLTAIVDQLFPEFASIFRDPNTPRALAVRERFPTPQAVAGATVDDLCAAKGPRAPGREAMARLRELASASIGVTDSGRQRSLVFEQAQLVRELRLLREHRDQLDAAIADVLAQSRAGEILLSLPGIGPTSAAAIIAAVGAIDNFPTAAHLKAYFGWAPVIDQTGTSRDVVRKTRGGERTMKEIMYLVALNAVQAEGPWRDLYARLVPVKCAYDERTRTYRGKTKVLGRIAGQLIAAHQQGRYRPMKPPSSQGEIVELPRRSAGPAAPRCP
jgi:transposase